MKKRRKAKKRLNIAQLHWGFPPIIGGVETHLTVLLPTLASKGHNVWLLTSSVEGCKTDYMQNRVHIIRSPLMDLNWLFKRGFEGLEEEIKRLFTKFIDRSRADVIHAHNMHYFSKLHAYTLQDVAKRKGIPIILTAHNVWDDILYLDLIRDINWAHIIAVSHYIKKELIGSGCDDRKITVVHHGMDTKKYRPGIDTKGILKDYPMLKNRRVLFHPARMGLAKGCDTSIKALDIVKDQFPDVMLVLAGTKNIIDWGATQEKDIAYMVNLIKFFNLRKRVLIDAFTLEQIRQIYALSEVCMYPSSVGEPFGLTMLEAMASEKPMIVTMSGGMPEIIQDGITGFVIPIKDFEVLASRIILLLTNERLRKRLGSTGRQIVTSHYTKDILAKNILGIYRKYV